MTLHDLQNNECATVISCQDKRLCDIGLCRDTKVWMTKSGNTCIINLSGTRIGIGRKLQGMIQIKGDSHGNNRS